MWFADIVLDLPWFVASRGKLGEVKARASQMVETPLLNTDILLYGDADRILHLRVMIHTDDDATAQACVDNNIHRWINGVEVASALATAHLATAAMLSKNSARFMVFVGNGDEAADSVQLDLNYEPAQAPDFAGAALLMAAWKPEFRVHLHYLARFLNHALPAEVRWLNGYRFLEWHFMRGKVGLGKSVGYKQLVADQAAGLDAVLAPGQTRTGLIEEVRALVAHALLARSADAKEEGATTDLVLRTFAVLERLVMIIMNQGVNTGVQFMPASEQIKI